MSAQVDVLEVLDRDAAHADAYRIVYGVFDSTPQHLASESQKARDAVAALIAERDALRAKLEQQPESVRYPSYGALLLIAQSVAGALERAGLTDCDDPGEAIDVIRERLERRISELETAPHQPAPVVDDADATEILALSLDEFGYHTEARNVRAGEDLDEYRTEMWAIRAALARAQGVQS